MMEPWLEEDVDHPSLDPSPIARGDDWLRWVNEPQAESELKALRQSIRRGRPFGSESWPAETAKRLGLVVYPASPRQAKED